ncbi:hypothetical protein M2421_000122 [Stenotrophomonas sp. BIGb0135]|nr:hypothetical protein [Stenotrophomonas sp. BIGb0135]
MAADVSRQPTNGRLYQNRRAMAADVARQPTNGRLYENCRAMAADVSRQPTNGRLYEIVVPWQPAWHRSRPAVGSTAWVVSAAA